MRRAVAAPLLIAALWGGLAATEAQAHSGLVSSDPLAGATLGASPSVIRLTFSEEPEPSLSEIRVLNAGGTPLQSGPPEAAAGDPLVLTVPVPKLPIGTYTVSFRAVSAVDGHATVGAYAFGIGASPAGVVAEPPDDEDDGTSLLELFARWTLLLGLGLVLGASVAALAGFAGTGGGAAVLASAGWFTSVIGLVLLTVVQRRTAGSSLEELLDTPVGDALVGRALAIVAVGAALIVLLIGWRSTTIRRIAYAALGLASLAAIAVHVEAGHAGAGGWSSTITVTAQVAHFAAAGVWFGGLAALLVGIRGRPSAAKTEAVRRFAWVALAALLVVVVTGTVRAVDELASFGDLFSTGYGRAIIAKVLLIAGIVALAFRNRRRAMPRAGKDLEPLRRTSRAELVLAASAVAVAAVLGSLAPGVAGPEAATPAGLSDSGSDAAETVSVELETASEEPGPNNFTARIEGEDTDEPVEADRVSLRFNSLDDPSLEESTLEMKPGPDGDYVATGSNLEFDGRWEVVVLVETAGETVEVPLLLDLPMPELPSSVLRLPDEPTEYTLQDGNAGYIKLTLAPEKAGTNRMEVSLFTVFQNEATIEEIVVTAAAGDEAAVELDLTRASRLTAAGEVELAEGDNTITVVGRIAGGIRMSGRLELDVSAG